MAIPPPNLADKKKFSFDTDFFDITVAPSLAPGAITATPATASPTPGSPAEKREKQAREEGFAAGLAEGRTQALQAAATEVAELKNALLTLTEKLSQSQTAWQVEQQKDTLSLLRVLLHHVVGHATDHYPDQVFEHFLHTLMAQLGTSDELTLRIHPQARTYHEKLGLPQASIAGRPFHILPDAALGPADILVEWRSGGLEARLPDILTRIDALLQSAGADKSLPVPPAPIATGFTPPAPLPVATPQEPQQPDTSMDDLESAAKQRANNLLADDS